MTRVQALKKWAGFLIPTIRLQDLTLSHEACPFFLAQCGTSRMDFNTLRLAKKGWLFREHRDHGFFIPTTNVQYFTTSHEACPRRVRQFHLSVY